jgi:predicted MPP superfamily phosphohydrolase
MTILFFALMMLLFLALVVNAGRETYVWRSSLRPDASRAVHYVLYAALVVGVFFTISAMRTPFTPVKRTLVVIASYALGLLIEILVFSTATSAVAVVLKAFGAYTPLMRRILAASGIALVFGAFAYSAINALFIRATEYSIAIGKPSSKSSIRALVISDLHLGAMNGAAKMRRIADRLNELDGDLLLIAGDVFDGDFEAIADPDGVRDAFKSVRTSYGVFACLGNHDGGEDVGSFMSYLESCGVALLSDDKLTVEDAFVVVGRRDSSPIGGADAPRDVGMELSGSERLLPVFVMDHQPSHMREYPDYVDLIVSGHTHRGQIFPAGFVTRAIYELHYGHKRLENGTHVIVSSGVCTWGPPLRSGSFNEIVVVDIATGVR